MAPAALIGREAELAELEVRARAHRLVTLIGPGGVGKTALAIELADRVADSFPLGVRHVDLTRIDDVGALAGALAAQLGFDSFDSLLSSPADQPVLLVVDNCEHLLEATADVLLRILGACRQPTIVATSRSPLELPGECVVAVAPLEVPTVGSDAPACPSVRLFLQRCQDAGTKVEPADLPQVVDLCRQLDGLPLAIEIAAARARTLSIAEIGARLTDKVDVLSRPRFRGAPRHRSLAETIHWSYDLLSAETQSVFEQVGVFAGWFSASTARSVVRPEQVEDFDEMLDILVDASLVAVDTTGPQTRYRLLDTVRRFALAELDRHDDLDSAYDRFVDHVVASSLEVVSGATRSWRPDLLSDLVASFDDVAEALRWCNRHDTDPRRAHTLCAILWTVVHQGRADDIGSLVSATLDRWPDRRTRPAAQAVAALATVEYVTGRPTVAVEMAEATLAGLDGPGLPTVTLLRVLGQARRALDDDDGALDAFQEGIAVADELGMAAMSMELEVAAAQVMADAGDVERAVERLTDVIERSTALGSTITTAWAEATLGWVQLRVDPVAALPFLEATLERARQIRYPIAVAVDLRSIAFARILMDDTAGAIDAVRDLLRDLVERGALSNARLLLDVTAALAHRAAHPAWPTLAATARSLPISTMACARFELIPVPPTAAGSLPRHDAINAVTDVLAELETDLSRSDRGADARPEHPAEASISRRGDICEFRFRGREVSVRTTKGVTDLVRLIEAGGREVHCLDLLGAAVEQTSTGEVIDAEARRRYEQRIRDLQEEIDEAEHDNDHARAYRYQTELDGLVENLTVALGQGGRTRRATDNAERARSAVTHRLRSTIRQFDKVHPALGRHLRASISTGAYCSYRPENATTWRID